MPQQLKIHILGASGSGTSTLGKALSQELRLPNVESDDVFWLPTDPPYSTKRPLEERKALLAEKTASSSWIFSGSAIPWGDFLRTTYTHVIFLTLPPEVRMARLRSREQSRYGKRLEKGGDLFEMHQGFLEWAALYDTGGLDVRSRVFHESWLRALPCPVFRLSGLLSTDQQVARVKELVGRSLSFTVEARSGAAAAPLVDAFYGSLGRSARARPEDLFFLAMSEKNLLGCVRFCIEEGTPLLRGMLIAEEARKQGIGQSLLRAFEDHLNKNKVVGTYCLPHGHLESFYGSIGFQKVPMAEAPRFLQERAAKYARESMPDVIVMRR